MKNANGILAVNNNDSIGHLKMPFIHLIFETDFNGRIKVKTAKIDKAIQL